MRFPPPLAFAAPLLVGLTADHFRPVPLAPAPFDDAGRSVGAMLIALGVLLAATCMAMFVRRRTTIVPHGRAGTLVTDGPYRFSRNPMYVALTTIFVGVTALANSFWPLMFLWLPLVFLRQLVIPMEERALAERFGAEYEAYAARTRRWL